MTLEHVDLVLLHQAGDAAGERLHDLVAVLAGARDVERRRLAGDRRTRRRPRPRSARPRRAASPWPGCRPRSGSARRASRPLDDGGLHARAARRGSRPRSRPGPEPITTMSYLSAIAAELNPAGSLLAAAVRHLDARQRLHQEPEQRARERRSRPAATSTPSRMLSRRDQQQRPDTIRSASSVWKPEHRPVARAPHADGHRRASAPRRRASPASRRCRRPRRRPRTATTFETPSSAAITAAIVTASGRSPSSSGTSRSRARSSLLGLRGLGRRLDARRRRWRAAVPRARRLRRRFASRGPPRAERYRAPACSRASIALAQRARGRAPDRRRRGSPARPRPARRRRRRTSPTLPASMPPIAKKGTVACSAA